MGSGFNFFTDVVDKTPATTGSFVDVDCSANIPAGSTGVILDIHNTSSTTDRQCDVRKNGSTDDDYADGWIVTLHHYYVVIGVDANRIFEAKISSTTVKIYLKGYTDENVVLFTNKVDKSTSTTGSYVDTDVSANVSADATGVILKIVDTSAVDRKVHVRKNGSTDDRYYYIQCGCDTHGYAVIGIDTNKIFEQKIEDVGVDVYLIGYTKPPVTFFTNGIDKSLTSTGSFTDIDLTADTEAAADGAIWEIVNTHASTRYKGEFRKNGSTDNHTASSKLMYAAHIWAMIGLDTDNICEGYIGNVAVDFYLIGYCKPAVTNVNVSDSGSGADTLAALEASMIIAESGSGVDTPTMQAQLSLSDSGVGSDSAMAMIPVDVSDSGVGSDMIAQLQASISIGDNGVGAETPSLQASLSISDSGQGVDTPQMQARLSVLESGVGQDVLRELQAQLTILESGAGVEVVTAGPMFTGIIRSSLSMLERDMMLEKREVSMTLESLERKMKMGLKEIGMILGQLERKMKMELIE